MHDLEADAGETVDLQDRRPDLVQQLRRRMQARLDENARLARRLDEFDDRDEVDLSPAQKARLKSLGY